MVTFSGENGDITVKTLSSPRFCVTVPRPFHACTAAPQHMSAAAVGGSESQRFARKTAKTYSKILGETTPQYFYTIV